MVGSKKVWGAIVNNSRTLVVQLQSFLSDSESETIKRISHRQIAWCFALTKALRGLNPIEGIEQNLSIDDLKEIQQPNNKHLAILMENARDLKALRQEGIIDGFAYLQFNSTLTRLCDSMAKLNELMEQRFLRPTASFYTS
jgi:putative membrane protein